MRLVVNGERVELPDGATLADLVAGRLPSVRGVAAAVDGAVVPRDTWRRMPLSEGQVIELLTAVQGG